MGDHRRFAVACLAIVVIAGCGAPAQQEPPLPVSMNLTDSSTGFGLRLTSRLLADPNAGNVFISPLSATLMLSMAASASEPATRAAILKTIGLDPTSDPATQAKSTIERLAKSDENAQLELAQAVWTQIGLAMSPSYLERLRSDYRANIATLDFVSPNAPKVVNDWVDKATHHKISGLVDQFDPGTVAYVVNATYFHAIWATEFDSEHQARFRDFSASSKLVPMMKRPKGVPTVVTPDYQAVVVPYKGGRFSMVILLPRKLLTPADFSRFLTPSTWSQVMAQLHAVAGPVFGGTKCQSIGCDGALVMPKFKLEYRAELLPLLVAMRMGTDLSLMCGSGCALSQVTHKTYLEVDEKGTTAVAATGGGAGVVSLPPTTVVDHPFVLALIDNASDAPLFLGVIGNL